MKVLIVDDHQLFLEGFSMLLAQLHQNAEIYTASSADEALRTLADEPAINLILLDMAMPQLDGMSLMSQIQKQQQFIPIVFVSATENIYQIKQIMDQGAFGFIPKQLNRDELIIGLQKIINGEVFLPDHIAEQLAHYDETQFDADPIKYLKLSARQLDVLRLMEKGLSNKEISERLGVSVPTVKSHTMALYQAMDVNSRFACLKKAKELGII